MPDQQPCDGLPRKYRGRCQPRTISKQPLPKSIKPAWTSHYTPQSDQPSMKLRHWTRQIRRIQSLKQRLNKTDVINLADENLFQQLTQEWAKILAAAGFYKNFSYWIFQHPELHPMPEGLPSATYLYTMEQLLKHQTDDLSHALQDKANAMLNICSNRTSDALVSEWHLNISGNLPPG